MGFLLADVEIDILNPLHLHISQIKMTDIAFNTLSYLLALELLLVQNSIRTHIYVVV